MKLTTKQKVFIIKSLSSEIYGMNKHDGTLFLKEYTKQEKKYSFSDTKEYDPFHDFYFSYEGILKFLQNLHNMVIYEMYKDLFPEEAKKEFLEMPSLYHLPTDKLLLFFSHSNRDMDFIAPIKNILEKTNWINCFVAHKDSSEGRQEEVRKHLECCHCLIAFLSEKFKSSPYCDQELGIAIHRQIPIFPVKLDQTDSYGFIRHIQATVFNHNENVIALSNKIESWILDTKENSELYHVAHSHLSTATRAITSNFLNSTNIQMAESVLDQLMAFKTGQIENHFINDIQKSWSQNGKIKEVQNIEKRMEEFFKKHPIKLSKNDRSSQEKTSL